MKANNSPISAQYHRLFGQAFGLNITLLSVLATAFVASLFVGRFQHGIDAVADPEVMRIIIWQVRLPRALLAVIVGGSLGLSGAALQGWLRNPLVDPGIIGTTATASLGAVVVLYLGLAGAGSFYLPFAGMIGAIIGVVLLFALVRRSEDSLVFILAGVVITSFAGAATSLVLNLSPSPFAALEIVFWLLGSLEGRGFNHVALIIVFVVIGWVMLLSTARALYALSLGEEVAQTLGANLKSMRLKIVTAVGLCVGSSVAVTGAIGFVGLIAPHIVRPWVKHRADAILVPSLLSGAILLLVADIAVRLLPTQTELKIGVLTALLGAPFFLWSLNKHRRAIA
ncbi:MAG: iron complex transport system permease protein [Gammaproteobacteria bacterium]|jgi:iron complex transport system permease protein